MTGVQEGTDITIQQDTDNESLPIHSGSNQVLLDPQQASNISPTRGNNASNLGKYTTLTKPSIKYNMQRKSIMIPVLTLFSIATAASIMYLYDSRRFNPINFYNLVSGNTIFTIPICVLTVAVPLALIYSIIGQYHSIREDKDGKNNSFSVSELALDEQQCQGQGMLASLHKQHLQDKSIHVDNKIVKYRILSYNNSSVTKVYYNTARCDKQGILNDEDVRKTNKMSRIGLVISQSPIRVTVPLIGLIVINATILCELYIAHINLQKVVNLIEQKQKIALTRLANALNNTQKIDPKELINALENIQKIDLQKLINVSDNTQEIDLQKLINVSENTQEIDPTRLINALDNKMLINSLNYKTIINNTDPAKLVHAVDFTKLINVLEQLDNGTLIEISDRAKLIKALDPVKLISMLRNDKILTKVLLSHEKLITALNPTKLINAIDERMLIDTLDYGKLANAVKHTNLKQEEINKIIELKGANIEHINNNISLIRKLDSTTLGSALDPTKLIHNINLEKIDPTHLINGLDPEKLIKVVGHTRLIDALDHKNMIYALDPEQLIKIADHETLRKVLLDPKKLIAALEPTMLIEAIDDSTLVDTLDYTKLSNAVKSINLKSINLDKSKKNQIMMLQNMNTAQYKENIELIRKLDHATLRNALDPEKLMKNINKIKLETIDPTHLINGLDHEKLIKVVDHTKLINVLDPKLMNVLDPKKLSDVKNKTELIEALNHIKLINILDPQKLIKVVEPAELINALDRTKLISVLDPATLNQALNYEKLTTAANAVKYCDHVKNFYWNSAAGSALFIASCVTAIWIIGCSIHYYNHTTTKVVHMAVSRDEKHGSASFANGGSAMYNPSNVSTGTDSNSIASVSSSNATNNCNTNISINDIDAMNTKLISGNNIDAINTALINATEHIMQDTFRHHAKASSTALTEVVTAYHNGPTIVNRMTR